MSTIPNILVFLTDDHGRWASSAYGHRQIISPTMDYLRRRGVRMDRAFTPSPVCSPARASFWTGKIPSAHGIHDYLRESPDVTHPGIQHQPHLGHKLQQAGYRTAMCGKWHVGGTGTPQPGFDFWYSMTAGTNARFGPQPFNDNGQPVEHHGHQAPHITDAALRFLRDAPPDADAAQPFFLFVGYTDTHAPFTGSPERLVEHYRHGSFDDIPDEAFANCHTFTQWPRLTEEAAEHEHVAQYYAAVTMIDQQMGRLLDHLESNGQLDNTLIVYTADHGHMCGHHGMWRKGNATLPANFVDDSIRIPMTFAWPDRIPPGQARRQPFDHCDLHATVLDAAGLPPEPGLPGRSYLPTLAGGTQPWRDVQLCEYGPNRMLRTEQFKLIKRYPAPNGPWRDEFYDLLADPRERRNVIDDPRYASVIADLTTRLEEAFAQHEEPAHTGLQADQQPWHNPRQVWDVTLEQARQRI